MGEFRSIMSNNTLKISVAGINQVPDYTRNFWEVFNSSGPVAVKVSPEPENPYDPEALKITANGKPLGYVPKKEHAIVKLQRDFSREIEGKIAELGAVKKPDSSFVYCLIEI